MPRLTWRHRLARRFRPGRLPEAAEPTQPTPPTTGPATHPAPCRASGPDAHPTPDTGAEVTPGTGSGPPGWEDTTISFPRVGRVGWLTLAQEWRANRGRR
ncbi:hypothetical protein TPA0907_59410 [Micromonospora humidisoli]|nr:hypothetical protein TPA0907_59410 [Micromonospora sp. AKA109]